MGPSIESLALADYLISKLGLQVDRISLAYAIMDHVEVEYSEELSYEDRIAELEEALAARQPVDSCTESECKRCRAHPDHRGSMEHAGISDFRQPVGQTSDTEIDARLNALYREMLDSGQHNGGMSGVAWDRAVYRMASSQSSGNSGELAVDSQGVGK